MQKWEYLIVVRKRGLVLDEYSATDWVCYLWQKGDETGKEVNGKNYINLLADLGEEGWELVVGFPRSDQWSESYAGFTSSDIHVFKRSKE